MDHVTPTTQDKSHEHEELPHRPAYHLRIPKPNWQVTALLLITVIAGFQMIQLIRLKGQVAPPVSAAAATTTPAPAASVGGTSGLQSQVGGC
ncbi:MAG: hypothetical protein AAB402_04200 [Patescibacteria group bacterium]